MKAITGTISTTQDILQTLPNDFILEFTASRSSTQTSSIRINDGGGQETASSVCYIGNVNISPSYNGVAYKLNNVWGTNHLHSVTMAINTEMAIKLTVEGTSWKYEAGGSTTSFTLDFPIRSVLQYVANNSYVKNVKVKPL